MFEAYAYLLTKTCVLEVYGEEDGLAPTLVMRTTFQDRELCDWLSAQGVRTILLRDEVPPPPEPPAIIAEGGD